MSNIYNASHYAEYINKYTDIRFYQRGIEQVQCLHRRLKQFDRNIIVMAREYILVDLEETELDNY